MSGGGPHRATRRPHIYGGLHCVRGFMIVKQATETKSLIDSCRSYTADTECFYATTDDVAPHSFMSTSLLCACRTQPRLKVRGGPLQHLWPHTSRLHKPHRDMPPALDVVSSESVAALLNASLGVFRRDSSLVTGLFPGHPLAQSGANTCSRTWRWALTHYGD